MEILAYVLVFLLGVAQLGERLVCNQEVVGSNPIGSTNCRMEIAECRTPEFCNLNSAISNGASGVDRKRRSLSRKAFAPAIGRQVGSLKNE